MFSLVLDDPEANANSRSARQDLTMPGLAGIDTIL
jgi:hypothetical protein